MLHDEIVDIRKTWRPSELQPFRNLIAGGFVDMVMVGHLIHPRFSDDGDVPASLSALTVQKELRGKLGYRGMVITDDLDMDAIRSRYGIEEAAVMAIAAGADLLIIANHKTPDKRIAWNSTDGPDHAGVVTFHRIADGQTQIMVQMDGDPDSVGEKVADAVGVTKRRVRGNLERFKAMIEERGQETGAWRGEVKQDATR